MHIFRLTLSEKRDTFYFENIHERFIQAENRDVAYNKSLKIAATFFNRYNDAPTGIPDKDMIFWFNDDYAAIWINSLEELEVMQMTVFLRYNGMKLYLKYWRKL